MARKFTDVESVYIKSDIEKIQRKPLMYIRQFGEEGILHLIWEVIQNAFDECIDTNSPGDHITITYDHKTNEIKVKENGRGFPENNFDLSIYCTRLQSGSKFNRDSGSTSGEFGVGLTVVNALSESFTIESRRYDERKTHTLKYKDGKLVEDDLRTLNTRKTKFNHGSVVSCIPTKKYFDVSIPFEMVKDRVNQIMHIIHTPKDIVVDLIECDGDMVLSANTLRKQPFVDLIKSYPFELKIQPSVFQFDMTIPENKDKHLHGGPLSMDIVIGYGEESWHDSYCNFTNTIDGGIHLNTIEEALCRFFTAETKKRLSEKEKEKLDITWADVKNGLVLLVNMNTVEEVFIGNAKTKITKSELTPHIKSVFNKLVQEYYTSNPTILNKILQFVKANAKMRLEVNKVRSGKGKSSSRFDDYSYGLKYVPANNKGRNQERELFIVEGNSAMNINMRDVKTQAFLCFKGNPANPFTKKTEQLLNPNSGNVEWVRYINIIQTGWGDSINPDKLYFKRINIMTDADVDGLGIAAIMSGFNMRILYPLIERGVVYKVLPPLYKVDDKQHEFLHSKTEMVNIYQNKIIKKVPMSLDGIKSLNKKKYEEFLFDTVDHLDVMNNICTTTRCNQLLIEAFVVAIIEYYKTNYIDRNPATEPVDKLLSLAENSDAFNNLMMKHINATMPEMILVKNGFVTGALNGQPMVLIVDNDLIQQVQQIIPIFIKYGTEFYIVENGKYQMISLFELVTRQSVIYPKILQRYKGLGEMSSRNLWDNVLDPTRRVSIKLTTDDFEREMKKFEVLYADKEENIKSRKKLIQSYRIDPMDIDT